MESKKIWKSKSIGLAIAGAALPFIPGAQEVVREYPQESMSLLSLLFGILRMVTKGKISL